MAAEVKSERVVSSVEPPSAFHAPSHWSYVGVTLVFGASVTGKSTLAASLVASSGASSVVLLGGYGSRECYERAHGKIAVVDTWDAAQQAMQAAREAEAGAGAGPLLVIDDFHSDESIDRQPWLRLLLLNARSAGVGVIFVYQTPLYLGRLLPVARACAGHVFVARTFAAEEGRRIATLLATVNAELNEQTKQLLDFVYRSDRIILHVVTDTLHPEQRFHIAMW